MTPDRVKELLDSYGADPARWPAGEHAAATALLASDPILSAYRDDVRALDDMLNKAAPIAPPAALASRILAQAADHAASADVGRNGRRDAASIPQGGIGGRLRLIGRQLWPEGPAWQPAVGLAASLAIGIWVGTTGTIPVTGITGAEYETADLGASDDNTLALLYGPSSTYEEWISDGS